MTTRKLGALLTAVLVAMTAAGCKKTGKVSRKVYYNNQPLGGGSVLFFASNGKNVTGSIGTDGSYTVDQVPLGTAKIVVDTSALKPVGRPGGAAVTGPPTNFEPPPEAANDPHYGKGGAPRGKYVEIPAKYTKPDTTDESYDVVQGDQEHDIKLK